MKYHDLHIRSGLLLVPGDIHFGAHNQRAVSLMQDVAEQAAVTDLVLPGDVFDVWGLSSHEQPADRLFSSGRLEEELAAAHPFLEWARRFRSTTYLPGNHEARAGRLSTKIPALHGWTWDRVLEMWRHPHITCLPEHTHIKVGPCSIQHGDKLKGAATGPHAVLNHYPDQVTIYGHTHRLGGVYRTAWKFGKPKLYGAFNAGHLSDLSKQTYTSYPNWQLGFLLVSVYPVGSEVRATVEPVPIHQEGKKVWCKPMSFKKPIWRGP